MSNRINEMFFMRPWAVKEDILKVMSDIVDRRIRGEKLSIEEIEAKTGGKSKKTNYDYEVIGGVAHISIYGVIAKRANMVNNISAPSGTSIEEIERNFRAALNDESVEKILLDIDSPGGSVDGVMELADLIYESRGIKPVIAYANGMMASAAYWIGSSATITYASPSTEVGSIGVYSVIADWTIRNHQEGVKVEIIKAGKHKAAGHPDKSLTDDDRALIQEEVNDYYALFKDAVIRNRRIASSDIDNVATGRTFIGKKALAMNLIDGVRTYDAILSSLTSSKTKKADDDNKNRSADNNKTLTKQKKEIAMSEVNYKELTADTLKENRADLYSSIFEAGKAEGKKEGLDEGKKAGHETGVKDEQIRVLGIMKEGKTLELADSAEKHIKDSTKLEDAIKSMKDEKLEALKTAAPESQGANEDPEKDVKKENKEPLSLEEQCKQDWAKDEKLHKEYASLETYTGYKRAVSKGRISRIAGRR